MKLIVFGLFSLATKGFAECEVSDTHGDGGLCRNEANTWWWWYSMYDGTPPPSVVEEKNNETASYYLEHIYYEHIWELHGGVCSQHLSAGPDDADVKITIGNLPASTPETSIYLQWWAARGSESPYNVIGEDVLSAQVHNSSLEAYDSYTSEKFNGGNVLIDEAGVADIRIRAPSTYFGTPMPSTNSDEANSGVRRLRGSDRHLSWDWWANAGSKIVSAFAGDTLRYPHVHLRLCSNGSTLVRSDKLVFSEIRPFVMGGGCGWGTTSWLDEPYKILALSQSVSGQFDITEEMSTCPWVQSTNGDALKCMDGSYCVPVMEGWGCCHSHSGRAQCPLSHPIMCEEMNCGDHKCAATPYECGFLGPRSCPTSSTPCECIKAEHPSRGEIDAVCADHYKDDDIGDFGWCYVPMDAACDALPYESESIPGLGWRLCDKIPPSLYVPGCRDNPVGWHDIDHWTCESYASGGLCTAEGGYGFGWLPRWVRFEFWRRDNHTAITACCACGGGSQIEIDDEAEFTFGERNANACPNGYVKIDSKTICHKAAQELGIRVGNWNGGQTSSVVEPGGCFINGDNRVFYNTDSNDNAHAKCQLICWNENKSTPWLHIDFSTTAATTITKTTTTTTKTTPTATTSTIGVAAVVSSTTTTTTAVVSTTTTTTSTSTSLLASSPQMSSSIARAAAPTGTASTTTAAVVPSSTTTTTTTRIVFTSTPTSTTLLASSPIVFLSIEAASAPTVTTSTTSVAVASSSATTTTTTTTTISIVSTSTSTSTTLLATSPQIFFPVAGTTTSTATTSTRAVVISSTTTTTTTSIGSTTASPSTIFFASSTTTTTSMVRIETPTISAPPRTITPSTITSSTATPSETRLTTTTLSTTTSITSSATSTTTTSSTTASARLTKGPPPDGECPFCNTSTAQPAVLGPDWDALEFSPVYQCLVRGHFFTQLLGTCVETCSSHEAVVHAQCVRQNVSSSELIFRGEWKLRVACGEACWKAKKDVSTHFVRLELAANLGVPFQEITQVQLYHPTTETRRMTETGSTESTHRHLSLRTVHLQIVVCTRRLERAEGVQLMRSFLKSGAHAAQVLGISVRGFEYLGEGEHMNTPTLEQNDDVYTPYYDLAERQVDHQWPEINLLEYDGAFWRLRQAAVVASATLAGMALVFCFCARRCLSKLRSQCKLDDVEDKDDLQGQLDQVKAPSGEWTKKITQGSVDHEVKRAVRELDDAKAWLRDASRVSVHGQEGDETTRICIEGGSVPKGIRLPLTRLAELAGEQSFLNREEDAASSSDWSSETASEQVPSSEQADPKDHDDAAESEQGNCLEHGHSEEECNEQESPSEQEDDDEDEVEYEADSEQGDCKEDAVERSSSSASSHSEENVKIHQVSKSHTWMHRSITNMCDIKVSSQGHPKDKE